MTGETYGPLKVTCEKMVAERFGKNALIIRPGIVAGPHDPTDRFTYWALKLQEPGEVLIPGGKSRKVQWIDARDLAAFVVDNIENRTSGTFNLTANPVTMEELVKKLASSETQPVWIDDAVLLETGIRPFEFPFWLPVNTDYPEGFILADNSEARQTGWSPRSLTETAEAVRLWKKDVVSEELHTGISSEQEQKIKKLMLS